MPTRGLIMYPWAFYSAYASRRKLEAAQQGIGTLAWYLAMPGGTSVTRQRLVDLRHPQGRSGFA